ncbi:MAG: YihY/virulence factor BrkB family protein [Pseudobdellovibrionaceae bacterium]
MAFQRVTHFISSFFDRFQKDHTTTLASSLAYYTALSLAPLVILFVTLSSKLGSDLQSAFLSQVQGVVGADAAKTFEIVIQNAKERPDLATASGIFGALTLLLSASLIFGEMKEALNLIFRNPTRTAPKGSKLKGLLHFLETRLFNASLALSFILIMIVSLIASSIISANFSDQANWRWVNIGISYLSYIGIFSLIYRFLPSPHIPWKASFQGGLLTAFLFVVGKEVISLYLGRSALGSSYGAAGSIIVLLVWVYYSALITFAGAHVSSLLLWKDSQA